MDAEFKEQIGTVVVRVGPMAGPREGGGGSEGSFPELTRAVFQKNHFNLLGYLVKLSHRETCVMEPQAPEGQFTLSQFGFFKRPRTQEDGTLLGVARKGVIPEVEAGMRQQKELAQQRREQGGQGKKVEAPRREGEQGREGQQGSAGHELRGGGTPKMAEVPPLRCMGTCLPVSRQRGQ